MFRKSYDENEKRVIRILAHDDRLFSYAEIADWLNIYFSDRNGGTRNRRGVYGYLTRERSANRTSQ